MDLSVSSLLTLSHRFTNLNILMFFFLNFRLEIVLYLKVDLHNELEYISNVIREFTKNYQVWYVACIKR